MSSFSYIKDLHEFEPRGWNVDTREHTIYNKNDEDLNDNEIPHPYQDEFEDDCSDESDIEYVDDNVSASEDESDTSSVHSVRMCRSKKKFQCILQEEDFVPE